MAFLPVLFFSASPAFPAVMALLCAVGIHELYGCVKMRRCRVLYFSALAVSVLAPVLARFAPRGLVSVFVLFACAALAVTVFAHAAHTPESVGFAVFETLLVVFGFSSLVLVRDREPVRYLLIFVAAWATDTFAYFVGVFFGKTKLCPAISPKKTVAGAVGGVCGSVLGFVLFAVICNGYFKTDFSVWQFALLAAPFSVIGQAGDLAASAVKRHFGAKDYGKILPGHGGILDRFDSILPITLLAFIFTEIGKF